MVERSVDNRLTQVRFLVGGLCIVKYGQTCTKGASSICNPTEVGSIPILSTGVIILRA